MPTNGAENNGETVNCVSVHVYLLVILLHADTDFKIISTDIYLDIINSFPCFCTDHADRKPLKNEKKYMQAELLVSFSMKNMGLGNVASIFQAVIGSSQKVQESWTFTVSFAYYIMMSYLYFNTHQVKSMVWKKKAL